ncbi:hypothetical protein ACJMK2_019176 [Sinanodonta woodiana]|uniref:Uncharacterized protein n=1 Tax=Sinanodonta woodiana TaxID=1069815 RepID=A0ABD3UIN7_SINWO
MNTYCSTMENLSPEFIVCLREMETDTIPPKPGGTLECLYSNPLYNATLTSGHPFTNPCRLHEVVHQCGIQYIKQHCPDQINDYNNYYRVSPEGAQCPDASGMRYIIELVSLFDINSIPIVYY